MFPAVKAGFGFGGIVRNALPPPFQAAVEPPAVMPVGGDAHWMHEAFVEGMRQAGIPSPNPAVGCAFVKDGKLLATGATLAYGDLHAERQAMTKLKDRQALRGSTLYVTLEPCSHTGQQPPCTEALAAAGIERCVLATIDPNPLVSGDGIAFLKARGVQVEVGELRTESLYWHFPFALFQKTQRPVLVGKWAQTLDGHLADDTGHSKWISSPASRAYTHWLRQKCDGIMVGGATVLQDAPALTVRDVPAPILRQPFKIIFDPQGLLLAAAPEKAQQIKQTTFSGAKTIYLTATEKLTAATRWCAGLPNALASELKGEPMTALLEFLSSATITQFIGKPVQSLLVEGGSSLLTSLIHENYLDLYVAFIAPKLMLAQAHRLGNTPRFAAVRPWPRPELHVMAGFRLGGDVVLEAMPYDRCRQVFQPIS